VPAEELTADELARVDPGYPLLICVRATKPEGWALLPPTPQAPWLPDMAPARWNPVAGHYAT
jgi:hypothetical protein